MPKAPSECVQLAAALQGSALEACGGASLSDQGLSSGRRQAARTPKGFAQDLPLPRVLPWAAGFPFRASR